MTQSTSSIIVDAHETLTDVKAVASYFAARSNSKPCGRYQEVISRSCHFGYNLMTVVRFERETQELEELIKLPRLFPFHPKPNLSKGMEGQELAKRKKVEPGIFR